MIAFVAVFLATYKQVIMKQFGKGLFVLVIVTLGLASSCAVNEFDLEREVYERQIKQVTLGMSFEEFQSLFPQRISRGANKGDFGTSVAYEVASRTTLSRQQERSGVTTSLVPSGSLPGSSF